jgi:ubiquinol-cytochrome c reductase subunit 7
LRMAMLTRAQDTPYLSNLIKEIEAELKEREDLESMVLAKRAAK